MSNDINTDAGGPRLGGAGFWTVLAFAILTVVAAASSAVRAGVFFVLTLPFRIASWVLPGSDVQADVFAAGAAMGWIGWALLSAVWAPLFLVTVGVALKIFPALDHLGDDWTSAVRGQRGFALAIAAFLGGLAPALLAIPLGLFGLVSPWWIGPAVLFSAALLTPIVVRDSEHPVVVLDRLAVSAISAGARLIGDAARWASLALALVVAVAAMRRFVFGYYDVSLGAFSAYLYAALFLLAAAAMLKVDVHVRMDVFYGAMPARRRAIVNFIAVYLLLTPLCLAILVSAGGYADVAWAMQNGSPEQDALPIAFLLEAVVPAIAALVLAQAAGVAAREALVLTGVDDSELG